MRRAKTELVAGLLAVSLVLVLWTGGSWYWLSSIEAEEQSPINVVSTTLIEIAKLRATVERRVSCGRAYLMTRDAVPHLRCVNEQSAIMDRRLAALDMRALDRESAVILGNLHALEVSHRQALGRIRSIAVTRPDMYRAIADFEEHVFSSQGLLAAELSRLEEAQLAHLRVLHAKNDRFHGMVFWLSTLSALTLTALLVALGASMRRRQKLLREGMRIREEFLAVASHELKNPVTALNFHLRLLQRAMTNAGSLPDGPRLHAMVSNGVRQIERLSTLIGDLLDVSQIRSQRMLIHGTQQDLGALVEEAVKRFAEGIDPKDRPDLRFRTDPEVLANVDPSRIEQVVINLLSNATKYAPRSPIEIEVARDGQTGQLIVRDFGPGMTAELRTRVFEAFERGDENAQGLGLGLYIVKNIVHAHGGAVKVESMPRQGCTFTVALPLDRLVS